MDNELKERLINVLEGIKESFVSESGQQWYEDFCKSITELKEN